MHPGRTLGYAWAGLCFWCGFCFAYFREMAKRKMGDGRWKAGRLAS